MNTAFLWDKNSLFQTDTVSGIPHLIDKNMITESISKMENGKAAGSSGVVSEMVNAAGEAGVDMITTLVNQILVEGIIPAEWELGSFVNYLRRIGNFSERTSYMRLKLTDQILKTTDRIIEKLRGRQQVDIYKMQLGFMPRSGTTNAIFILRQLQEKYLAKKNCICNSCICRLKKNH